MTHCMSCEETGPSLTVERQDGGRVDGFHVPKAQEIVRKGLW